MGKVVSAVANAAIANSNSKNNATAPGEGGNGGEGDGNRGGDFAILLSKAMLHLARAAGRARWGRSWVKVRQVE